MDGNVKRSSDTILQRLDSRSSCQEIWRFPQNNEEWSLDCLLNQAEVAATVLIERGIIPRDRVALALPSGPEYVVLLLALWRSGATAVPLRHDGLNGSGCGTYLQQVDSTCCPRWILLDQIPELNGELCTLGQKLLPVQEIFEVKPQGEILPSVPVSNHDTAVLQMTSGTTSHPRAVIVTHGMIMDQLEYLSDSSVYYSGHPVRSAASWLPLNHDMGLFTGVLWPLYDGSDNLLAPPTYYMRNPKRWFRLLAEHRVDMNFATNTAAAAACKAFGHNQKKQSLDLSELQLYFGAEKLHADVLRRVEKTFEPMGLKRAQIHVGYGMAENALAATRSPKGPVHTINASVSESGVVLPRPKAEGDTVQEMVSVGAPFKGYDLFIRDQVTGEKLSELALGEICMAGSCLTPGYYQDDDATTAKLAGGFLRTGDLGFLYESELYFVGREDDLVNIGGRKLVPDDVEHEVENLPFVGVGRACFLGIEQWESGVTLPLLLVEAGNVLTQEEEHKRSGEIRRTLLELMDLFVSEIFFCSKGMVEKTTSGKKRRKVIRARFLAGEIVRVGVRDVWKLYRDNCKPKLAEMLLALGLDQHFTRAEGSYLYDNIGQAYLDLVGGFGATLLGHNPPLLVDTLIGAFQQQLPSNVQASTRGEAAMLACRLNQLLKEERCHGEHQGYFVTLTNSGTESVEAAIKHAYKVHFDKVRREYERLTRLLNDFYYRVDNLSEPVELPGKQHRLNKFRDDLDELNLAQFEAFQNNPVVVAIKGSYHGKTASSLKVTFNKTYREPFEGLSAVKPVFFDMNQPERLPEIVKEHYSEFFYPVLVGRRVELRPVRITRVIGLILEPILGEGGIRVIPDPIMDVLAEIHAEVGVPYILDEIQSGCGRTGRLFDFTHTPLSCIEPEYLVLSKALGGGISKIGAMLVRRDIYDQDFGILHTSTFGEDEISARVATTMLNYLTSDERALLKRVSELGDYLHERLEGLRERFPGIIREVRGRGLMLGVELTALAEFSPFFRAAGRQGVLSLLIASYLLHHHRIRLIAPLSTMLKGNPGKQRLSVLRIQPPLTVTNEEIDRFIDALAEALTVIRHNNEYCLVAHLSGHEVMAEECKNPKEFTVDWPLQNNEGHIDARTGFVVHPTQLEHLIEYYFPSFPHYGVQRDELRDWWNRLSPFLEPVHTLTTLVESNQFQLENNLVFIPYLPEYLTAQHGRWVRQEIRDKIQDAVTIAKELGDDNIPTSMVGLGAYTSIASDNCMTINDFEVPVTTGNAFTAALVILAVDRAARDQGLDIASAEVAVIGAAGNIGQVLAQILAQHVGRLRLLGRPGQTSRFKLNFARQACLEELLKVMRQCLEAGDQQGDEARSGGLMLEIQERILAQGSDLLDELLDPQQDSSRSAKRLATLLDEWYPEGDPLIRLGEGFDEIASADVVVVATSSPDPELIHPDMVKPGAIVCCASVPSNLSTSFAEDSERNLAFDGGLARLPEGSELNFVGMPKQGMAFGCVAEMLVLGFEGQNHSFCKGLLKPEQVYRIVEMAERHGFGLGDYLAPRSGE